MSLFLINTFEYQQDYQDLNYPKSMFKFHMSSTRSFLISCLFLLFSITGTAQTTIQVGYIENPTAGDPMLLSDTGPKGLSDFASMVNALTDVNGNTYAITAIQETTLLANVAGTLASYDIVLTGSAIGDYSGTPAQELESWVKAGGTLILYSDLQLCCGADNSVGQYSRNSMGIATWAGAQQCLDQKGSTQSRYVPADNFLAYNMTTREIQGEGMSPFIIDEDTTNHPSQGYPTIIIEKPSQNLAKSGGTTFTGTIFELGYSQPGQGLVFFVMDRQGFLNGPGTGTDITMVDNRQLAKNLLFAGAGALPITGSGGPTPSCKDITIALDAAGTASITASDIDDGSVVVFGTPTLSINQNTFSCTDLGPNTVILTVTDANGGFSTCSATVTVIDTIAPVAMCNNITLQLDASGTASLTAQAVDNGSSDNCGIVSMVLDQTSFDCSDLGTNSVTLTVMDAEGNSSNCVATVTIEDLIAPVVSCLDMSLQLDSTGVATITPADIDNGSSDNCGIASMSVSPNTFTLADLGSNLVTLTVTDTDGNTSTCTATVTVSNVPVPVASCQDITAYLDPVGTVTIAAADVDNGSIAYQSPSTMTISQTVFDCSDMGPQSVILTITDGNGASSSCVSTVTVADTVSPTAICQNLQLTLDASGSAVITASDIDNGSTDNCGISSMSLSQTAFGCADVGQQDITLTVTDAEGNTGSCVATVTVADNTAPSVVCQDVTLQLDATGSATLLASDIDNGSSDLCGIDTLMVSQSVFTTADLGTNSVTLTATDIHGNSNSCTAIVTVLEHQPCTTNAVTHLYVVQANTTQDLFELTDGGYISKTLGDINIRAEIVECGTIVESVKFILSGASSLSKTENFAPYVMTGDNNGVFKKWDAPVGSYSITVTPWSQNAAKGTAGTPITMNFQVVNSLPTPIPTVSTTLTSCAGLSDGSATVSIVGGTAPYAILWSDGQTGTTATGLSAGQDSVVVTDSQGFSAVEYFTISEPAAITATSVANDATDPVTSDGSIQLTIAGGTQPYSVSWNTGATGNPLSNLLPGSYTATITDNNNCQESTSATVGVKAPPIIAAVTVGDVSCFGGNDGTASLAVSGGVPPYSIAWSTGQTTVSSISGLTAGSGSVTITDAEGTIFVESFTISQPQPLQTTATITASSDMTTADGSIALAVSGGTAPYSITWSNGGSGTPLTGLLPGTYSAYVVDAAGCTDTVSATVNFFVPALIASVSTTDATCADATDGSATVSVSGGLAPYSILWQHGQTSTTAVGLSAGASSVSVTDAQGTTIVESFTVSAPQAITISSTVIDASDPTTADGSITVTIGGGTAPYQTTWNTGASGTSLTNLLPGVYTITATDAVGCTESSSITVDADLCTLHRVTKFYVVSVDSNTDLFELQDGAIISSSLGNINIRADVEDCGTIVESVRFQLTGATSKTQMENYAPWVLTGDNSGIYRNWDYNLGSHTITATPYSANSGYGTPGTPLTVNFQIVGPQTREVETAFSADTYSLNVHPNPASKLANITWDSPVEGDVQIVMMDQLGKVVRELDLGKTSSSLNTYFQVFELPAGLYSIRVTQGEMVQTKRFLKQ